MNRTSLSKWVFWEFAYDALHTTPYHSTPIHSMPHSYMCLCSASKKLRIIKCNQHYYGKLVRMEELASCLLGRSWSCRFAPANECYRMWTNVKTKWWQPKIMRNKLFLPWIRKQVRAFPSFLLGSLPNALHSILFSTHIYLFYTYIYTFHGKHYQVLYSTNFFPSDAARNFVVVVSITFPYMICFNQIK